MGNNEIIKKIQKNILLFLSVANYASWHIIKRNINNLAVDTEIGHKKPEYLVLYPLLRTGIVETARHPETGKLVYCLGPDVIIRTHDKLLKLKTKDGSVVFIDENNIEQEPILDHNSSLILLKNIPSLINVISHWPESEIKMKYIYDRFGKNDLEKYKATENSSKPNIYANSKFIYSEKYLKTKSGKLYLIPSIEENIDAFNIALSYLEAIKGRYIFIHNPSKKTIAPKYFNSMLPFVICRVLVLCDPTILLNGSLFEGNVKFNNVSSEHIVELKRVFGPIAVKEENE